MKIIFIIISLLFFSCTEQKNEHAAEKLSVLMEKTVSGEKISQENEKKNPMLPMKKVQILVGGCMELCDDPLKSFHNYLFSLKNDKTGISAVKFLDTTTLVYNGEELGKNWAEMWKNMQEMTRKESIESFAKKMTEWTSKVRSLYELDQAIVNGIRVRENWTTRMVIDFIPPVIEDMENIFHWVYILKPRGLEWLITEINQQG
jgi:hypothetical protein